MNKKTDEVGTYFFLRRYYAKIYDSLIVLPPLPIPTLPTWDELSLEQRRWLAIEYSKMHANFGAKLNAALLVHQQENSK